MNTHLALGEETPANDLRARVREVLERRKLTDSVSAEQASASWEQDRFVARARALFYARLMFLSLGLAILAVPTWSVYFVLPPLLALLVTIRLDLLLDRNNFTAVEVLTVLWYCALNFIIIYVLVYLN